MNIIKRLRVMFDPEKLRAVVDFFIRRNYNKGLVDVEDTLKLDVNVAPNKAVTEFISNYTFDLVKGMNDDLMNKLQAELQRGIMNNEGSKELKERIKNVMGVSEARAKTIARTESHRAYNMGGLDTARQSGLALKKKWYNPNPDSEICRHLNGVVVGINEKFVYKGEEFLVPPAHPNCRSRILYVQEDE